MDSSHMSTILAAFKNIIPANADVPVRYSIKGPQTPGCSSLTKYCVYRCGDDMVMEERYDGRVVMNYWMKNDTDRIEARKPFVVNFT